MRDDGCHQHSSGGHDETTRQQKCDPSGCLPESTGICLCHRCPLASVGSVGCPSCAGDLTRNINEHGHLRNPGSHESGRGASRPFGWIALRDQDPDRNSGEDRCWRDPLMAHSVELTVPFGIAVLLCKIPLPFSRFGRSNHLLVANGVLLPRRP
jgi:hypothetical protein